MSRLTKEIREKICKEAIVTTFDARFNELAKQENALAEECYNYVFPESLRNIAASMPEDWLRSCDCLRFNANGWNVTLKANKKLPTPYSSGCHVLGNIDGELAEKVQAHVQNETALKEERSRAFSKMRAFLEGFITFKQLEGAWSEGSKFYKKYDAERPSVNVPAVITQEINDMLGIEKAVA